MSNTRRLRKGVVKQLSNLSIDEISTVDRGANQHSLIAIAKRAPQAEDYFEPVEKDWADFDQNRRKNLAWAATTNRHERRAGLKANPDVQEGRKKTNQGALGAIGSLAGGSGVVLHGLAHERPAEVAAGAVGGVAGYVAGMHHEIQGTKQFQTGAKQVRDEQLQAHGVVHNHFYGKRLDDSVMDVDALFDVSKKGSFGQGGEQTALNEFTGNDPSGVTKDPNGEDGDIGPEDTIDGVETIEGEDTPPGKKKKAKAGSDINPGELSGLGKSAGFWKNVVSKVLEGEEFGTEYDDNDLLNKHFPGPPGAGGMQGQQPMAGGYGQPPNQQTVGMQPMGMGQPTPPPMGGAMPPMGGGMAQPGMQPPGGMPAQLPPDVVQYIQQLEQALDQLVPDDSQDQDPDQSGSTQSSGCSSSSSSGKQNPFGKSLETSMYDETTFLTELSKSLDNDDEREAINKALESVSKAERRAQQAETIAKQERDLRLEREFIAKAATFNLPIKSSDLGPVLKRAAENLDEEDFKTIVKCLNSVSASADYGNPYGEVGKRGGGDNADILDTVDAAAMELVGKASDLTPEAATLQVLNANPAAYDEYLRDKRQRQF